MAEMILTLESVGEVVFLALVNISLQVTLLILLVWLMIRVLRLRSAVSRYYLWFLAVFGILALPVFSALLPGISIPLARSEGTVAGPMFAENIARPDEGAPGMLDMEADTEQKTARQSWIGSLHPLRQLGLGLRIK